MKNKKKVHKINQEEYYHKLYQIIDRFEVTKTVLAEELGCSRVYFSYILHRKRRISKKVAQSIDFLIEKLNIFEVVDEETLFQKIKHPKDRILARLYYCRGGRNLSGPSPESDGPAD